MTQLGADADQLEVLARRLGAAASQIEAAMSSLDSEVAAVWWQGKDADRFRTNWNGHQCQQLRRVCRKLANASHHAASEARTQRRASGV